MPTTRRSTPARKTSVLRKIGKLSSTVRWWNENGLISNHKKCEAMLTGSKHAVKNTRPLQISTENQWNNLIAGFKYLGIYIDHCLTWSKHVTYIQARVYSELKLLNRIKSFLSRNILLRIYKQTVLPLLDYGYVVWGECSEGNAQCLERLQNRAIRIINNYWPKWRWIVVNIHHYSPTLRWIIVLVYTTQVE